MTAGAARTTGMRALRPRARARLVVAAGAAIALAFGLVAAVNPELALAGFLMAALVSACFSRGELAVGCFAGATYFDVVTLYGVTPIKVLGGVIIVVAILLLLLRTRRAAPPTWQLRPWIVVLALALVGWAIASVSWAVDVDQVRTNGTRLLTDVLVLLAIPLMVRRTQHLHTIGWCVVAGAITGAALGFVTGTGFGNRAVGMFADPNEFAVATVVGGTFAIVLAAGSDGRGVRLLGQLLTCGCLVAVAASASRSGVIAALVAFIVLSVTARGAERVRLAGLMSLGIAAAIAWIMFAPGGVVVADRLTGENSTGRTDLWRVARYQIVDEPIHGVGLGNFPVRSIEYLRRDVRNLDLFIRAPRTVHNTPLELLAELGIVGFLLFYGVVAGCVGAGIRALRMARAIDDARLVTACRAILASLGALLATSLTLSAIYVELQWVLLGCCIAAFSIARVRHHQLGIGHVAVDATTGAPAEDFLLSSPSR